MSCVSSQRKSKKIMQNIFEVMCTRVNVFCFIWCILFCIYMNNTQKLTLYMCVYQKSRCKDLGLSTTVEWQKFIDSIKNKRFAVRNKLYNQYVQLYMHYTLNVHTLGGMHTNSRTKKCFDYMLHPMKRSRMLSLIHIWRCRRGS